MKSIAIKKNVDSILIDLTLLVVVYFIPTISHLTALPLYMAEPMRIILFVCVLMSVSRKNVYFMAVMLPLFSFIVAGHPIAVKNGIMAIEFLVNIYMLYSLVDKKMNAFWACFFSITVSKVVYYILKFGAISFGMFSSSLISTSIIAQAIIALVISVFYFFIAKVKK